MGKETYKDNYDDSDSTPLNQVEDGMIRSNRRRRTPSKASILLNKVQPLFAILNVALSVVAVAFLASISLQQMEDKPKFNQNGDVFGLTPKFSQRKVTFKKTMDFVPEDPAKFFDFQTYSQWLDIVPRGLGYLDIKNPEQFAFTQQSLTGYGNKTVYTTSVTHQLHCLYALVSAYNTLSLKVKGVETGEIPELWHVGHCADYLRQSIMCCGDTAIEGRATTFSPENSNRASDGWGVTHVCRNYDDVKDWLDEHRVDDTRWI